MVQSENVSNQPKHNTVSNHPRKLDKADLLFLVYTACDTYAIQIKTHAAADILQSEVDDMAGDQLNHPSTPSFL